MAPKVLYSEHLCQSTKHQLHADQLTGAAGRGYFLFNFPVHVQSVWGKSKAAPAASVDWAIIVGIKNPETGVHEEFTIQTNTGTDIQRVGENFVFELPTGSYVKVTTSASVASDVMAFVCYGMIQESL